MGLTVKVQPESQSRRGLGLWVGAGGKSNPAQITDMYAWVFAVGRCLSFYLRAACMAFQHGGQLTSGQMISEKAKAGARESLIVSLQSHNTTETILCWLHTPFWFDSFVYETM